MPIVKPCNSSASTIYKVVIVVSGNKTNFLPWTQTGIIWSTFMRLTFKSMLKYSLRPVLKGTELKIPPTLFISHEADLGRKWIYFPCSLTVLLPSLFHPLYYTLFLTVHPSTHTPRHLPPYLPCPPTYLKD